MDIVSTTCPSHTIDPVPVSLGLLCISCLGGCCAYYVWGAAVHIMSVGCCAYHAASDTQGNMFVYCTYSDVHGTIEVALVALKRKLIN